VPWSCDPVPPAQSGDETRMFAEQLRRAVEASPRVELPKVSALLWKAYAAGHVTEAEASALSEAIEAKPGFPRWIGFRLTFWSRLSKEFRGLLSERRVHFTFTRCTRRDWALSAGISCSCS
jgi:hypothetical protein